MGRYKVFADPDWITPTVVQNLPWPVTHMFGQYYSAPVLKRLGYLLQNSALPLLLLEHPNFMDQIDGRLPEDLQCPFYHEVLVAMSRSMDCTEQDWRRMASEHAVWYALAPRPTDLETRVYRYKCLLCFEYLYDRRKTLPVKVVTAKKGRGRVVKQGAIEFQMECIMHLIVKHAPLLKKVGATFAKGHLYAPHEGHVRVCLA